MLEAVISESVFSYLKPTFTALRLIGAAPFVYEKNKECFSFKKSRKYIIYSYGFAAALSEMLLNL